VQVAAIALFALLAQAPATARQPQSGATVEGIVVQAGSGQPVPGARVSLLPEFPFRRSGGLPPGAQGDPALDDISPHSATTAQDGRFRFENVKPLGYRLIATMSGGFVPGEFGQRSATGLGVSFELAAGQTLRNVRLILTPTGSISGRVYDRDGPVGKLQVLALRPVYREGRRALTIVQAVQTNDRGEYRLFWLAPGPYLVMVRPVSLLSDMFTSPVRISEPSRVGGFEQTSNPVLTTRTLPSGEVVQETQLPVYYPGVTSLNEAARIELRAGGSADGMDIPMTTGPVRTRRVRGVVVLNGQPAANAGVIALPRSGDPAPAVAAAAARTNPDGSFDVAGVLPGSYLITANTNAGQSNAIAVEVGDADVDQIVIPLAAGFQMTGRFVMEGRSRNTEIANLRANLVRDPDPVGMPNGGPSYTPPPSPDGSFVLQGVPPGDYRVTVRALPVDAYVKSMRMGAFDVLDRGLHLTGAPREPLEIVIGDAGTLSGTVQTTMQEPVLNSTVVVIPDAPDRHRADLYKRAVTDSAGRFRIQGLAAGSYRVFAWEDIEEGSWQDPDVIRLYENRGASIRIREGGDDSIQLTVITGQ